MSKRQPVNLPASVRQRLLNLSRARGEDFNLTWSAFLSRNRLDAGGLTLSQIVLQIRQFLMPPVLAAANGQELEATWPAGGPWGAERG